MRPTDFDIYKLTESLQGTCDSIDNHLPEGMEWIDLTEQDHNAIDDQIFKCCTCDWWYDVGEMSNNEEENECNNCYGDEEE